jgi:predicted component of viral defense system (DUF524 family)
MPGHLMIVSKARYGCVGELSPVQMHELKGLKDQYGKQVHDSSIDTPENRFHCYCLTQANF